MLTVDMESGAVIGGRAESKIHLHASDSAVPAQYVGYNNRYKMYR
jgi:hypothetical protein